VSKRDTGDAWSRSRSSIRATLFREEVAATALLEVIVIRVVSARAGVLAGRVIPNALEREPS
jgi:hypothetical protein